MRVLLLALIVAFGSGSASVAQDASRTTRVPAEHKAFFGEYSALLKKYPSAASRFGMFDQKYFNSPKSSSLIQSQFCTGPSECCSFWVEDENGTRCQYCSLCLP